MSALERKAHGSESEYAPSTAEHQLFGRPQYNKVCTYIIPPLRRYLEVPIGDKSILERTDK